MDTVSLDASPRDVLKKKVATLRRAGLTPVHLYGRNMPSKALQAESASVAKAVHHVGYNMPLYLNQPSTQEQDLVLVREVQRHPITNRILHVDFYRIDVTQTIEGAVPIVLVGESPAVRIHRGNLLQVLHELTVECLPMDMPERIEIDISVLEELDQDIRVADFTPGPGITVLSDPEELIARVSAPRAEEEGAAKPEAELAAAEEAGTKDEENRD